MSSPGRLRSFFAAAGVLAKALGDEVRRTGLSRGLVGLSGGIDSAVSLLLGARALGPGNMLAVALPVRGSSPASLEHARLAAGAAEVELRVVDLGPVLDGLEAALPGSSADRLRRGNMAARARMISSFATRLLDTTLMPIRFKAARAACLTSATGAVKVR